MKKNRITGFVLLALCLCLCVPSATAETRQGVIWLEGMEESIEETLFESPEGFSFWYAVDGFSADFGIADHTAGVVVTNIYSDDYMILSMISEEEAAELAGDIAEQSAAARVQADISEEMKNGKIHFCTLIGDHGKYLRVTGAYFPEAAEGTAKYFRHFLDSVAFVHPDALTGRYADGGYNEVILEKRENDYAMSVTLYRLTSLDEGTVSFLGEKVIFHTLDASGNPMTVSFYPSGPDQYALRVEESTWPLLEQGTVYEGLEKQAE